MPLSKSFSVQLGRMEALHVRTSVPADLVLAGPGLRSKEACFAKRLVRIASGVSRIERRRLSAGAHWMEPNRTAAVGERGTAGNSDVSCVYAARA